MTSLIILMVEIERKFLVKNNDFMGEAQRSFRIVQGFLNTDPERTVRVRLKGDRAQIAVKGLSSADGLVRFEWEHEISAEDAESLLKLCEDHLIVKTRYLVKSGDQIFEIDVFHGENEGLVIAEIELMNEEQAVKKPGWLGEEVTGQIRYYNSYLSGNPYKSWKG